MKKKLLLIILSVITAICCAVGLAACNKKFDDGDNGGTEHTHALMPTAAVGATCTESGNVEYWYCSKCGKYFSDSEAATEITQADTVIAALGHDYDYANAVATWSGTSATVTVTCKRNGCTTGTENHSITIAADKVTVTSKTTKEATCTEKGVETYTATFTVNGTEYTCKDTHTEEIPALGHDYDYANAVAAWSGTSATVTVTCKRNGCTTGTEDHSITIAADKVTITSKTTKEATCTEKGEETYTATFTVNGKEYTCKDTHTEEIPALGHDYDYANAVATWSGTSATVTVTCKRNGCTTDTENHSITIAADKVTVISKTTKEATCTEKGEETYTATFIVDGTEYTCKDTQTEEIPALGHNYDYANAVATWSGTSATVTVTCKREGCTTDTEKHSITIAATDVTVTSKTTKEATCTEKGETTYTATFTVDGTKYTCKDTQTEEIPALGHDYDYANAVATWSGTSATVTVTCKRNGCTTDTENHSITIAATDVTVTSKTTKEATCTEKGVETYTATFTVNGKEYTCKDTHTEEIPALGHDYDYANAVATWSGTSATVTVTCKREGCTIGTENHSITIAADKVTVTSKTTKEATCTEKGVETYTATFTVNGTEYTCKDTHTEEIPALGHDYDYANAVADWSGTSATVTVTCKRNGCTTDTEDHSITIAADKVTVTSKTTKEATCTEKGEETYTATFTVDGTKYTCKDTHTEEIAALDHTSAEAVTENRVEATCTTAGSYDSVVYCSICKTEISREKVTLEKTGHSWGEVSYTWTSDNNTYTCTATRTCKNDSNHVETETVNSTYDVTTAATCTEDGLGTYTATFKNSAFATQTKEVTIEKTGHTYSEDWSSDENCHWHVATCEHTDEVSGKAAHNYGEWTYNSESSTYTKTCTVCSHTVTATAGAVAAIGETCYTTLSAAITAATAGETVTLLSDVTLTSAITVSSDVTLDLNKCTLKGSDNKTNTLDVSSGTVTVKNGTIEASNNTGAGNSALFVCGSSNVTVENCVLKTNSDQSYVFVTNGSSSKDSTIVIKNSTISAPTVSGMKGYAAYIPAGNVTFENCDVTGHILISGGNVTLDGGTYTATGFNGQSKIWGKVDTVNYLNTLPGGYAGNMGDSILITDRRAGYELTGLTIRNITFNTEISGAGIAYAIKYVDFNKNGAESPVKYIIENNTFNQKIDGADPVMFIDLTGLYDASNKLIVTYADSRMDVTTGYTSSSYKTSATSPYCVLTNSYTTVVKIILPDTVTSIGRYAFKGCTSLTSITIPSGVTSIGSSAFEGCTSLTSITIPDGVTKICDSSFSGCTSLTSITVPVGVTNVEASAFQNCTVLSYNKYDNACYLGNTTNPYVVLIKATDTSISSCTINDNTKVIYEDAFSGCTSLKGITIPDKVETIGNNAFSGCSKLESATIGSGVTIMRTYVFNNCTSLKSITIPDNIRTIGTSAFDGCTSLKNVTMNGVTSIGSTAFRGCAFESITIPDKVMSIGNGAFQNCTSLTSITIGSGVTEIGSSAFSGCTKLASITIPDNVTSIGSGAFDGTAYYNAESNWEDGVLYIGKHLIVAKTSISGAYEIKSGTLTIANYAFQNCTSLTSIVIPDSVKSIGYKAFSGCTALTSVTFNNASGWWRAASSASASGTSISSDGLADTSTAATYLKSTYYTYYWTRS